MKKHNKTQQSRLELYLKNMDLLKITPSASVAVYNTEDGPFSGIESFLTILKNWSVCECYIFGRKEAALPYLKFFRKNTKSILKSIQFVLENNIPDAQIICEMRDTITEIVQHAVFCTDQYKKLYKIWGQDVIQFFGNEPEVYEVYPGKRTTLLDIRYPENVIGIFKTDSKKIQTASDIDYTNLLEDFDRKTGKLKIQGNRDSDFKIFVVRIGSIFFNTEIISELDYSNPEIGNRVKEIYSQFFSDHPYISIENFHPLEKFLPNTDFKNIISLPVRGKNYLENQESKKIIQNLIFRKTGINHNSESNFNLKQIFIGQFEKKILPLFNTIGNKTKFTLSNSHPWFPDLVSKVPVIPQIDQLEYVPGTPYETNTEINIRLLSNSCTKFSSKKVPVQFNQLLSVNKSFSEMKYEIDSIFLAGANHVIFNHNSKLFSQSNNLIDELEEWDPNYLAYFDWFAYIHQLGHFFKLGIRRPELLVLYPSHNESLGIFKECITEIGRTGLDYSLINFDTFNNNALSKIEDNEIIVFNHSYRIVVLPGVDAISIETMQKLNRFYAKGGILIAIGNLPAKSSDNRKRTLLDRIKKQIWLADSEGASTMFKQHESGGLGYFQSETNKLSNILEDISKNFRVILDGKSEGVKYQLREIRDSYLIFFLNTNQAEPIEFNFITRYFGRPYLWDFTIGESDSYPFWYVSNHKLHLKVRLAPRQSQFFIIDRKQSLKLCQLYASELDFAKIIKQDEHTLQLDGWQRQEGHYKVKIKNASTTSTLSYSVDRKLPILGIDPNGWFLDSEHFKGQVSLGDQSYPFPYQSSSIKYHKVIILKEEYLKKKKLMLNLGKVKDWCKIYLNNQFVKQLLFEPFLVDITGFVKAGENKISIEVTNRLANRLGENAPDLQNLISVHEYGLFGPVKIIPYSAFTLKI